MDNFFDRRVDRVAEELVGRSIMCRGHQGTILRVEGFARQDNINRYAPVITMQPGEVYCGISYGYIMLLLVTADGGCVLIRGARIDGVLYNDPPKGRPGKVSSALGLTEHGITGTTAWLDEHTLDIRI